MSAAVGTAFEELVSHGDTAEYKHAICAVCHPDLSALPAEVVTLCGERMTAAAWHALRAGMAKCSTCLTCLPFPCGHP